MEPWVYTDKSRVSSAGAALTERVFGLCRCGSWLCIRWESVVLAGLFYVFITNQLFYCFHALARACPQAEAYKVSDYSYLCKDLILGML